MKKYKYLFTILLITSLFALCVSADNTTNTTVILTPMPTIIQINITTIPTTAVVELSQLTERYYGTIYYINNIPAPEGTRIVAKDQFDNIIGKYTTRELGIYSSDKYYDDGFDISVWKNMANSTDRNQIVYINFFINGVRSRGMAIFTPSQTTRFDILIPELPPTPAPTVITTQPTAVVPTVTTISPPTTQQPIEEQPTSATNGLNPYIYYGIIATIVIIIAIAIVGVIASYLITRANKDTIVPPK